MMRRKEVREVSAIRAAEFETLSLSLRDMPPIVAPFLGVRTCFRMIPFAIYLSFPACKPAPYFMIRGESSSIKYSSF